MLSRCKCNQSEYIQIECFRVANVFNLNTFILNVLDVVFKLNVFSFKGDDESLEDGLNVESEYSDEEQFAENTYLGGDEAAVDDATTSKEPSPHTNEYSARESLICPYYDPPIVTFDGSDWNNIIGPRGQKFAIGADSILCVMKKHSN